MLLNLILLVSLIAGLFGMAVIIIAKLLVLNLTNSNPDGLSAIILFRKMGKFLRCRPIGVDKMLKKILMKTKIIFLKGENTIDFWLERVSSSKKFKDEYWSKIKRDKR